MARVGHLRRRGQLCDQQRPAPGGEATRLRVLAAIEQTGYWPNDIARALTSGSTQTYRLVVPDISTSFFATLARALQQGLQPRPRAAAGDAGVMTGSVSIERSTTCCAARSTACCTLASIAIRGSS